MSGDLLDQATCPHASATYDRGEDDWTCWDCGAYCNHNDAGAEGFVCAPTHERGRYGAVAAVLTIRGAR